MRFPFKKLKQFMRDLDEEWSSLSQGGCGYVATIFAYHLHPYVDDIKIVTCGGGGDIDEARCWIPSNTMDNWMKEGVRFDHVWVEFKRSNKWYAIDVHKGICSRKHMHKQMSSNDTDISSGSFTLYEMRQLVKSEGWNDTFDTDLIVPYIKRIASRRFKQIFAEMPTVNR